ncbi:hypothetical protein C7271_24690 [filamentous cyanobacterium CCP5]|nr:hypothetical protein C7271_24690 [filamentous cyanobacterium CCP5]
MAYKVHEITSYNYSFDARSGSPSGLQLWGESGKIAEVKFVENTSSVPEPSFSEDLSNATAYFKQSSLAGLIDMLRNENPVSMTINNQSPGFVFIHTGPEPVGEAEG